MRSATGQAPHSRALYTPMGLAVNTPTESSNTMRMSNGFVTIAEACVGVPYGHVPGHQYHDVEVALGQRGVQYRAVALETWGSCQGLDEEQGRIKVVARGADPRCALTDVLARAKAAMSADAQRYPSRPIAPARMTSQRHSQTPVN